MDGASEYAGMGGREEEKAEELTCARARRRAIAAIAIAHVIVR